MKHARLAIVTGATGGIGACVAQRLWQRGYRLALLGRDPKRLDQLHQRFHGSPGCVVIARDLSDTASLEPTIAGLEASHGPIEVLVNNAGYNFFARFSDLPAHEHQRMMQVNYLAPMALIRATLPGMLHRQRGWVINVASISAKMGPWGHAAYAASKAALICSTQSLAAEHPQSGVHFSYVNPGIVDTPYFRTPQMQPLWAAVKRHAIQPDRVARTIERLLDRPRLEVCVPGSYRVLDWLAALSPTFTHRLVKRHSTPATGNTTDPHPLPQPPAPSH